jgi:hypothetical protein
MAGNTINLELKLNSNIKDETRDARAFHNEIKAAAAASQNIEYGRARGAMGSTGASARDFANQAQGLGGLVRIYATVAANSFAAISAFNALKQAADTTTLKQGLDQLGAASGIALGALADGFVKATDGAISFREAAQAAAKATSAGLSSRQFLQIGDVAKKASQALGIDLNDAVNRLTRGITKLEPELLDELGIYTKIGPAVEEYARKIGKAEVSLTDFERRQAFAIAVLDEGNKKFGEIDIPANPYQQLEASIRNLTQAGLELVNKFLLPIADVFAKSSTLLTVALGAIAIKLTQMAIPALTSWRSELLESAKVAKDKSQQINEAFGERFVDRINASFKVPELKQNLTNVEQQYQKSREQLLNIDKDYAEKRRSAVYKAARDPGALGSMNDAALSKLSGQVQKEITAQNKLGTDAAKLQVIALQEYKQAILQVLQARKSLTIAEAGALKQAEAGPKTFAEWQREQISRKAGARAERLGILAAIGENVEVLGFTEALKKMNEEIKKSRDMNGLDKLRTRIQGTFTAGITAVSIFLRSIGTIGQVIAAAAAAFAAFDSYMSRNTKQVQLFNEEIEKNTKVVENSQRMLKLYVGSITTDSLSAVSTSLGELIDGVDALTKKLQDTLTNQGWWDSLKQSVLGFFGEGVQADFATQIANNWTQQIASIPESEAKEAVKEKLRSILNITDLTSENIRRAVAGSKSPTQIVTSGQGEIGSAAAEVRRAGGAANATRESINNLTKASQELQNTFADTSPLTKFADALIKSSFDILESLKDMRSGIAAFKEILAKPAAFAMLEMGDVKQFQDIVKAQENLLKAERERATLQNDLSVLQPQITTGLAATRGTFFGRQQLQQAELLPGQRNIKAVSKLILKREDIEERIRELDTKISEAADKGTATAFEAIRKVFVDNIIKGFDLLNKATEIAKRQGVIQVGQAIISGISGPGSAAVASSLKQKELDLQLQQINTMSNLADQLLLNTLAVERATAARQAEELGRTANNFGFEVTGQNASEYLAAKRLASDLGRVSQIVAGGGRITGEQATTMEPGAAKFALQRATRQSGEDIARQAILTQKEIDRLNLIVALENERRAVQKDTERLTAQRVDNTQKIIGLQNYSITLLAEEQLKAQQQIERQRQFETQKQAFNDVNFEITKDIKREENLRGKNLIEEANIVKAIIQYKKEQLKELGRQQGIERNILFIQDAQQQIAAKSALETFRRTSAAESRSRVLSSVENELQTEQQLLDIANERGRLTPDQYAQSKKSLDLKILDLNTTRQQEQVQNKLVDAETKLNDEISKAVLAATEQNPITPEQLALWAERRSVIEQTANDELLADKKIAESKRLLITLQYDLTDRQKAYTDIFKNSFNSLADAMVNWMQTGKLAGKELFNSLIADLTRYELKLQMMEVYKAARPGILSFAASLTGGGGSTPFGGSVLGGEFGGAAKGAYFDGNVAKFAKGGMFTNSVVNQPTLFKFARGTGLMGEAGPEAIMPLKRDSQGNLGVSGGGQKTEVVINNYSNQPATTQETTDSRGNRKIEVVIGEMTAGEFQRSGSTSQRAMRSTFGLAPQLIRR